MRVRINSKFTVTLYNKDGVVYNVTEHNTLSVEYKLVLPHHLLLAPREALELVVAAIEKIKEHADELQPLVSKLKVSDTTIDVTYHRM